LGIGFSDVLSLYIDGEKIFHGSQVFKGFADIPSRGWVSSDYKQIELPLKAGDHKIAAEIKQTEAFGWGLIISLNGQKLNMKPIEE
jgi:hypothetical protein